MLSTTLRLFGHPHWLIEHLQLYAALGRTEAALAWRIGVGRAVWAFLALGCTIVALNLAGLATLLWLAGIMDPQSPQALAGLIAVPMLPALGAAAAWVLARRRTPPWFAHLRMQMDLDGALLNPDAPPSHPEGQA
jgi:hypothetical protein